MLGAQWKMTRSGFASDTQSGSASRAVCTRKARSSSVSGAKSFSNTAGCSVQKVRISETSAASSGSAVRSSTSRPVVTLPSTSCHSESDAWTTSRISAPLRFSSERIERARRGEGIQNSRSNHTLLYSRIASTRSLHSRMWGRRVKWVDKLQLVFGL